MATDKDPDMVWNDSTAAAADKESSGLDRGRNRPSQRGNITTLTTRYPSGSGHTPKKDLREQEATAVRNS